MFYKNKLLQLFTPSLNWLGTGDRIGILQTQDSALKVFINGEELPVQFPTVGDNIWAVFELRGQCYELAVTSHKVPPPSPMARYVFISISLIYSNIRPSSARLQDSLEIVLDQEQAPVELEECTALAVESIAQSYEFHENHGRNVELQQDKSVARRVASYNQGMVAVTPAMECNKAVQVAIEQLDSRWQSSIIVGVVAGPLDRLSFPVNALALKGPCCVIANDWISINGTKVKFS